MQWILFSLLVTTVALSGCKPEPQAKAQAPAPESQPAAAPAPPARPSHFYAVRDGLEYGYEGSLSEEDRRQGRVTAPLKMYRYLGAKGRVYQVALNAGDGVYIAAECEAPCEFAKIYSFAGVRLIGREMMRLPQEALLRYVFLDAMSGQLEQWVGEEADGTLVRLWVDGEKKRLITERERPKQAAR